MRFPRMGLGRRESLGEGGELKVPWTGQFFITREFFELF